MKNLTALCAILSIAGCQAPTSAPQTSRSQHPIVNGTRDPQTVELTEQQIRSIGWLFAANSPDRPFCTGTLIAPNMVATAAHCIWDIGTENLGFGVGTDPSSPEGTFLAEGVFPNYDVDAALILLGEDVTASGLDITPIPVNRTVVESSAVGRAVQAGGYGDTRDPETDGRWFATVYISRVMSEEIIVDGRGEQGLCFGDSGSGLIDVDADGHPVVLAVESWGEDSCVGVDHMTRLDIIWDWIEPILGGEYPEDPCGDIATHGDCEGDVAVSCLHGRFDRRDCVELGSRCELVEEAGRYDCTCVGIPAESRCNGATLETCLDGRLQQVACGIYGRICGWDDAEGTYDCIDSPACRPEDEAGRCDNDVAINCHVGWTTREFCAVDGKVCVETSYGADCIAPSSDGDADEYADADIDNDAETDGGGEVFTAHEGGCSCRAISSNPLNPSGHLEPRSLDPVLCPNKIEALFRL